MFVTHKDLISFLLGLCLTAAALQIEFHYWRDNAMTVPRDIMKTMTELTADGRWRAFHMEPNLW